MTFADAVQSGLKNSFKFVGLATRREFWYFQLFVFLVGIVASTIDSVVSPIDPSAPLGEQLLGSPVTMVFSALLFIPQLSMLGRRFRDVGFSEKWIWLWAPASFFVILVTLAIDAVEAQGQAGTLEGMLNVFGFLYPAAMICSGILLFFFVLTVQPSKPGSRGNKYAPGYDATLDPKSDDYAGAPQDWEPKL
jgi:uncharacterized membrane protein YhaH (DUF805 family)